MWTRERPEVTAMARTTAKQVLDRVDALLPNGYARAEKLRWLAQAEGFVRRELCRETGELPVLTEVTELTAEPPFDAIMVWTSCIDTMWRRRCTMPTGRRRGTTARRACGTTRF